MTRKQYIAAGIAGVALLLMLYAVPALAEQRDLTPSIILGAVCLTVMTVCVFKGGLTDVSGE